MLQTKQRILYLLYLLLKQNDYMNSFELAKKAEVSDRTIKNDISELKDLCESMEIEFISKKGIGYKVILKDEKKYDFLCSQLEYYIFINGKSENKLNIRVNEILRYLITQDEYKSLDDIALDLFLTTTSLREAMKEVNGYLKSFNLSLKNKNEIGPLVKGREIDKRRIMLFIFEDYYNFDIYYAESKFAKSFAYDANKFKKMRQIFLKCIRETDYHIIDSNTQIITRYLCLMINRIKDNNCLTLKDNEKAIITNLREYNLALKITKELECLNDFYHLSEDEIMAIGLLLAERSDITIDCNFEAYYPKYYEEAKVFLKEFKNRIIKEYGIDLSKIKNYDRIIISGVVPLLIQKDSLICDKEKNIGEPEDNRIYNCPLAIQMSYDASILFYYLYGIKLSHYNIINFSNSLRSLFLLIDYNFKPLKVAVCSSDGLATSNMIATIVKSRFDKSFEKIDTYELYELRDKDIKDYDYVILDLLKFSYKYDWPIVQVNAIPTQEQLNDIYNNIVLSGVDLTCISKSLDLPKINVYNDFDFKDYASFINLLSYKMASNASQINNIEKSLLFRSRLCISNQVCVLYIKHRLIDYNCFDVYKLKNEKLFRDKQIKYIVVMGFNFKESITSARFINDIMYMLFNNLENIEKIIANPTNESLVELARNALKMIPISLA